MEDIRTLFDRLYKLPFPSERGKEVLGVNLIIIDSNTMGLATCFLGSNGQLTTDQIKMLNTCYTDLNKIIAQVDKHEKEYYATLRQLAKEMLESTSGKNIRQ